MKKKASWSKPKQPIIPKAKVRILVLSLSLLLVVGVALLISKFLRADTVDQVGLIRANLAVKEGYSSGKIVNDFLKVGFSDIVWNQDTGDANFTKSLDLFSKGQWDLNAPSNQQRYSDLIRKAPWWADFVFLKRGLPRYGVLHKWSNGINIAYGWPDFRSYERGEAEWNDSNETGSVFNAVLDLSRYPIVEEQVKSLLSEVTALTGLPVRFIELGSKEDASQNFAGIRILPISEKYGPNAIGESRKISNGFPPQSYYPMQDELRVWGAISFEGNNGLMEGYFLPDTVGNIEFAVCKISTNVSLATFRRLVDECVIRSLGLPGLSSAPTSILGNWRETPSKMSDVSEWPQTLTNYERLMLSTLYSDALKSNMDKNQLIATLLSPTQKALQQLSNITQCK